MPKFKAILVGCLVVLVSVAAAAQVSDINPEIGVSKELAIYRKSVLNNINYTLSFDIPKSEVQPVQAEESIKFDISSNQQSLQLDFREDKAKLKSLRVNGRAISILHEKEHILIDKKHLKTGSNVVKVVFEAGESALNRNEDYLYTLFVPDRARTVYPCFDQPDLKATFNLILKIPAEWKAMSNTILKNSVLHGNRKTYRFETSDTLSTYLFAFVAGNFNRAEGNIGNMRADFLYRENDTAKINHSIKEVFDIHSSSLKFFEQWTEIPYPFAKFGFAAIPDFQFGGMEHPGNIQYKASSLFLDAGATKDQLNTRSNLIAHETAHMWFGDLVTMSWFDDVWMKEVFANFMADKSTRNAERSEMYDLKFLIDHFPPAYAVDRTQGSNPIRQQLDNLKEAGTMYGSIIYHKAPIMMRQLERLMGEEPFRKGVVEYLRQFSNGNASWPDLINILDKHTAANLKEWNEVWVNETGRPIIEYDLDEKAGKIRKMVVRQKAEHGRRRLWPQFFELALYYPDGIRQVTVNLDHDQVEIPDVRGAEMPLFILFNSSGQGYGLWPLDRDMFNQLYVMQQPLHRATAYISLYENMLNGRWIKPLQLLELFLSGLKQEKEELNLRLLCGYISSIYWQFIATDKREELTAGLEKSLWQALVEQHLPNNKKVLFKTYQNMHLSGSARAKLYKIWNTQRAPDGVRLTEDDYTSLAFALALRDYPDSEMLNKQLSRISNADRRARFRFIMPALSPKVSIRDSVFKSLELKSNRTKEPNVLSVLSYLHHPLRQATSVRYLQKTLEMLEEIQVSGDIFFPQGWLQYSFENYQSKEAADIVSIFLKSHPDYNQKLKSKILQAADNLIRSQKLLNP